MMTTKKRQFEVLNWASSFLEKNNCEPIVAEILLRHHLNIDRSTFFAQMHERLSSQIIGRFISDIKQHVHTGIPVQHLLGYEMFYGRKFLVNEHVLIPRPETEELTQHVIEFVKANNEKTVIVDVGTGSGVIAITLALELPKATIYATDISTKALQIARRNAEHYNANVIFLKGNFLQPTLDQQLAIDIVVSNPPYIAEDEKIFLPESVRKFDPSIALFAKNNGLFAYESMLHQMRQSTVLPSQVFLEIGYQQARSVHQLITSYFPQSKVNVIQDMQQKNRFIHVDMFP